VIRLIAWLARGLSGHIQLELRSAQISRYVSRGSSLNLWAGAANNIDHAHAGWVDQYHIVIHRGVF
jgi:hypothetical protein